MRWTLRRVCHMAVLITFPDGSDWYVTNGFGWLVQNHAILFPDDAEMQHELEMVGAVGGIVLGEQGPPCVQRLLFVLEKLAVRTIEELQSEKAQLVPQDSDGQQQLLQIMHKLLPLVKRAKAAL